MSLDSRLLRSASSFAILAGLMVGGIAQAQAQAPGTEPALSNSVPLSSEQVEVNATKRKQKAQDVNLDLTVLGAAQLKNLPQIKSAQDAINFIPNAQGQTTEGQTRPRYFVRGIGTNNVNFNAVNPLGTYYDDIYIANVYDQALPIWDLDHVELLEGPQGTLWGKNANAGAINFISKAPSFKPDAYVTLGAGSFGEFHGEGGIGGGLVPGKLAGRFSFLYDTNDGWQHNLWNNSTFGGGTQTAIRQQFLLTPTDDLSILLNFHARNFNGDLRGVGYVNDAEDGFPKLGVYSPYYTGPGSAGGYLGRPPATAYDQVDIGGPNNNKIQERGGSAKVTWVQPAFTVTSITGYENNVWSEHTGANNTPYGAAPYTATTQDTKFWEFSQELRIASPATNRFTWLAGLYGFADSASSTTWTGIFAANPTQRGEYGGSPLSPELTVLPWTQDTHSYAGFANVGYKITSRLKVDAGLRWTTEHTTIGSAFSDLPGAAFTAAPNPQFLAVNTSNYTSVATNQLGSSNLAQTQRAWTYDITPEYKISDNVRSYFRYAHGVLPGNYSFEPYVKSGTSLGTFVPFQLKEETLDAYELGLKTQWFDRRLTLNGTIFHYDYNNAATNVPTPYINGTYFKNLGLATAPVLFINAGGETVDGGDIEFDTQPTRKIHIGGNAGWLRAVYDNGIVNQQDGIAGQQVPRSPHLTSVLYGSYNETLPWGGNLLWAADTEFKSKFYYYPTGVTQSVPNGVGLVDQQTQTAYALVNAALTWYPFSSSGTSAQFSVQNLLNKQYTVLKLQDANGANAVYNGQPRTFLFSVTEKFF